MTPEQFVDEVAQLKFPSTFNPYAELCPQFDAPDAIEVRRKNLIELLTAAIDQEVDALWIARDLGYRGGRRTGLPLTDEAHLKDASQLLGGADFQRATVGSPVQERTASVIWHVLNTIGAPVMLWNVFPLHPFSGSDPLSNRCHNRQEREAAWPLLDSLIQMIEPNRIFAIGRDSQHALRDLGIPIINVRHPSYGGQAEFVETVFGSYGKKPVHPRRGSAQLSFGGVSSQLAMI